MNLPEFSIRKPVSIIVAMLIFLTIGVISILKLPLEMMPDTSFPGLMVQISYPSSSPEEVERTITRPIEDTLSTVNNLENLSSTSSASGCWIHNHPGEFRYPVIKTFIDIIFVANICEKPLFFHCN